MKEYLAMWDKPNSDKPVQVRVLSLCTASISDSSGHRPVAIIADSSNEGQLRYVELKFLKIVQEDSNG